MFSHLSSTLLRNECNSSISPFYQILPGKLNLTLTSTPKSNKGTSTPQNPSRFHLTRSENMVSRTFLYRLARIFADYFIASYNKETKLIVLDFDDTEDDVHGGEQLDLFNALFLEINENGINTRCMVTDLEKAGAKEFYQKVYCERGNTERDIKELKLDLKSDRTSCHRFVANQFRLFFHSAAYGLIPSLQTNVWKHTQWAKVTMETIRLRWFKIGAKVQELKTEMDPQNQDKFRRHF